jgi:hypothetical protein
MSMAQEKYGSVGGSNTAGFRGIKNSSKGNCCNMLVKIYAVESGISKEMVLSNCDKKTENSSKG